MQYNPDIHHRRSIGLKGYDYAKLGAWVETFVARVHAVTIESPPTRGRGLKSDILGFGGGTGASLFKKVMRDHAFLRDTMLLLRDNFSYRRRPV